MGGGVGRGRGCLPEQERLIDPVAARPHSRGDGMSNACAGTPGRDATREHGSHVARRAARFLHLAAAPTFAVMALATGVLGGGADALCSVTVASPFSGMVPMYLLMSAFHATPWLKLIAGRRPK